MTTADVAIIGNGILGSSVALALSNQDPALRVALIGPEERVGAASLAAGAMLNTFAEVTKNTLRSPAGQAKFQFSVDALRRWPDWIELLNGLRSGGHPLRITPGTHVVLNGRSGVLDSLNFDAIIQALVLYGEPYEETDPRDVPGIAPVQDARPMRALYLPDEGSIDSRSVLRAIQEILVEQPGVCFVNDSVARLVTEAGSLTRLILGSGDELHAARYVVAAGAFSQELLDQLPELQGVVPKVFAGVGVSMVVDRAGGDPITSVVRSPNRSGSCGLHVVPHDARRLYIGASNNVSRMPETRPRAGICHFLAECALEQIDQRLYDGRVVEWRVGNRPASIDTFPLIGYTPVQNLYLLTGTYRDGFHCSPLLAEYVATELTGGTPTREHPFNPARVPIATMTVEESINEWVLHYITGAYENALNLPKFMYVDDFADVIEPRARRLYDQLDTAHGLPPEMLAMIEFSGHREDDLAYVKAYLDAAERELAAA